MSQANPSKPIESFRVPNSIVQGLTTTTPAGLNRLTSFQMVTLFGLMAHVSSKHPDKEVRLKVCEILEIIRISKCVTQAIERIWTDGDGRQHHGHYRVPRYSPRHMEKVHEALLALHNQSVAIHYFDPNSGLKIKDHIVHLLDSFGYCYQADGRQLDVDDLPRDRSRVNVATDDRPVWKVRRRTAGGHQYERPTAVTFRLNRELAQEILGSKGTIRFTLFAHRVFDLFRDYVGSPAAIRLVVLTLRQIHSEFTRCLTPTLDDLGFDTSHLERGVKYLEEVLERLRGDEIVTGFAIDREADRITITLNRDWYRGPMEAG
ncbi:MAG: hypothetical protein WCL32_06435 [Planctomycetota bacterium]